MRWQARYPLDDGVLTTAANTFETKREQLPYAELSGSQNGANTNSRAYPADGACSPSSRDRLCEAPSPNAQKLPMLGHETRRIGIYELSESESDIDHAEA